MHEFRNSVTGEFLDYGTLIAVTGLSHNSVRNRLREYEVVPTDPREFVKRCLDFPVLQDFKKSLVGAEYFTPEDATAGLTTKERLDELDIAIKEEKLRESRFKNDRQEGLYVLVEDVQLALDNFFISLKTNLEALPAQVAQSVMSSRTEHEAAAVMLESLKQFTRQIAENPIVIGDGKETDEEDAN